MTFDAHFDANSDANFDGSDPANRAGGRYKGRGRRYLPLLVCPADGASLAPAGDEVICTADPAHRYPVEDGVLRLVNAMQRAALDHASYTHEEQASAQGWQSPDEGAFKSLPQTSLSGYPPLHWPQYVAATALLWRYLEAIRWQMGAPPVGPMGAAAVIGAGLGWLAYALDVAGYTTIALDALAGPRHGLGVYPIARYVRVQADPVRPPLAARAFDLVLFQEGLARAHEEADEAAALARGVEALRPGGHLAVMDAFLTTTDALENLRARLENAGLRLMPQPPRLSWRTRLSERLDHTLGRNGSLPLVIVAQKPG